ncbi:hypothetical protein NCCP28_41650 [Niallia sp. NCCP-28]|nr:hypothetical protein NCCP28_41650 [Niallia sp. NCCP-28]
MKGLLLFFIVVFTEFVRFLPYKIGGERHSSLYIRRILWECERIQAVFKKQPPIRKQPLLLVDF